MKLKRLFAAVCFLLLSLAEKTVLYGQDWMFTGAVPQKHRGPVNAVVHKGDTILSAGEDGFLEIWNPRGTAAVQRFQISPYNIVAMAGRPNREEVCIVESDGQGQFRISAWNYREHRKIFSQGFGDSVNHISYSTGGTFIIAARTGRTGLSLLDSTSGNALRTPPSLLGIVSLAVTGRSERNMAVYHSSGILSYWDLDTGRETSRFEVPANLSSPVLFSNSRYFAGVNAEGLAVVHATTGEILGRDSAVPGGSPLCVADDTLICLVKKTDLPAELYRYSVDRNGRMASGGKAAIAASGMDRNDSFTSLDAFGSGFGSIALGTAGGSVVIAGTDGRAQVLAASEQWQIVDAAVSGGTIAFISENGMIGFIPLNYSQLPAGRLLRMERSTEGFNRITAYAAENGETGRFIFWQDKNNQAKPVIRSAVPGSPKNELNVIMLKSPISSVASFGGKIQFMDNTGNLTVILPFDEDKGSLFNYFSVGMMDAGFVDSDRLIIGRSAVFGNTPFMIINISTGETVPLAHPSQAAIMIHRGLTNSLYAAIISAQSSANEPEGIRTAVLRLNLTNIAGSARLIDFQGEDTQFSLAETPSGVAATIGGEGAAIYTSGGIQKLDVSNGIPIRLVNGDQFLISLDKDGNLEWYDSHSGKLLAIFRLQPGKWTLQTDRGIINGQFMVN